MEIRDQEENFDVHFCFINKRKQIMYFEKLDFYFKTSVMKFQWCTFS